MGYRSLRFFSTERLSLPGMAEPGSDEELMIAYVAGDQAAFRELFERYAAPLLRVLARDLSAREEAHDLVQQTFLHLHRARNEFDRTLRVRPWIYTIALNLKREHLRRRKRRPEHAVELEGLPGASDGSGRTEAANDLHRALSTLPADQREVIELHWFADLEFKEIATIVGASLTAVKVRAHRGYGRLREALGDASIPGNSPEVPTVPTSENANPSERDRAVR